ncbi:GNAT family N-acetyltransferase [candidate division WOR-3 bacterium]|uniref:GNAT family N-acetyltransferase n=1 Tax=candidate division WOR-3 bacterium TaxID=2052148 RepID=A0A937XHU7_UNCW3|nr:GNAT family N-acetyltransferase [candidate division WOR-3 bacterium]
MLEGYRPEYFREVASFARRCPNFFYVTLIIKAHTKQGFPGECHVWREDGRIVAFSAVAFLNPDDAWLWGMRVDPEFRNKGVAARFTEEQLRIAKAAGRTWAGLNTLDHRKPAPTFRVMEKLGFRLEDTYADDVYWRRPKHVARPRLAPFRDFYSHSSSLGRRTYFHQHPGWFCSRLIPQRRREVNRLGFTLDGVPLMVRRRRYVEKGRRYSGVTVNLFDRPPDFATLVPRLLALVPKRGHMVVNYPVEWQDQFRAAARAAVPKMKKNRGYWPSVWRIYGKELT